MIDLLTKLKGVTKGSDDWTAKCPAHNDRQASLSIAHRDGKWLLKCHKGCTVPTICAAIGVELSDLFDTPRKTTGKKSPDQIFAEAQPISPTFPYFPARGIDAGAFPKLSDAVRFTPACWHKESQTERPALIAAVTNGAGEIPAIQRLYLTADHRAKAGKPMALGRIKGLAIQLGPPTETIYLAEGFEDAATAQQANGATAWAAVGASNLPNVVLPKTTKGVIFLGQNDKTDPSKHDPTFARYASQAARKFVTEGKSVHIAWPPAGVKDINDLVRGKTGDDLVQGYVQARAMLEDASASAPSAPPSKATWLESLLVDGRGNILLTVANVLIALRSAPELADTLAYDELLRAAVLTAPLPLVEGAQHASRDPLPRAVTDEDVTQLQEWLQRTGLPKIGREAVHQAVDRRAREFTFHKLRDWLDSLRWDGKPRLDKWLSYYLGAENTPYHRAIGKMFLIAMVARIFDPGCKADYVLILEGPQGILKSEACRILGGEYFSDNLPDIRSKDASQYVRGLWLIELPELSALSRADVEAWKAFITRKTERYRQPYGRRESIEPRQCSFIGTTNKTKYLHDETGNRRFWPVRIVKVDLDALKHDRGQLFAEAVHCYHDNEPWWPDQEFERTHILDEQEDRFEVDAWEEPIREHLDQLTVKRVQICDLGMRALGFLSKAQIGTVDQRRIARILDRLGWAPGRDWKGRFYVPKPKKIDPDT
jgi:predicted P-loop ATPase